MALKKNNVAFVVILSVLMLAFIFFINNHNKTQIVGNEIVKKEIDRLLLPVSSNNITEKDFDKLKNLVKDDEYAGEEVDELIVLAKYREYSDIGHNLGFLYEYVKTGSKQICPGHLLSHYYVFLRHEENKIALNNLNEAKEKFPKWINAEEAHNESYLIERNYTFYKNLITEKISEIEDNNSIASKEEITSLADAPCI